MPFLTPGERRTLEAYCRLVYTNPFLSERLETERRILGRGFVADEPIWSANDDFELTRPNLEALTERAEALASTLLGRLRTQSPTREELALYVELACYVLYYRVSEPLRTLALEELAADHGSPPALPRRVWERFRADYSEFFEFSGRSICPHTPAHLFALCSQTRRAFIHVFTRLVGASPAAARLRAEIWHSIFTHNPQRYMRVLYERMRDLPTLITGESGTGKEIVAASIARSQYRAFDEKTCQFAPPGEFAALNLSALPTTLIESELFGHKRGSFTGATSDRRGWLEIVGAGGCVFLDEVADIAPEVQVKLLRVLQERIFQRIGDTRPRQFVGKIIAATNRDLGADMAQDRFRPDLYYRLSGDLLRTPTLREQTAGSATELRRLVTFVARRIVGNDQPTRDALVAETLECIGTQLGPDYPWPGNFRELEQCVRNVLVRRCYTPLSATQAEGGRDPSHANGSGPGSDLPAAVAAGALSAEELLTQYAVHVYSRLGTYEAAARHLGLDRRTVRARVSTYLGRLQPTERANGG